MTQALPSWMVEPEPEPEPEPAVASAAPTWEAEVVAREVLAAGVVGLELRRDSGTAPRWEPGAHVDVHLPPGIVEAGSPVRQYSLCGDPTDSRSLSIAVLREPVGRGGSAYLHDRVRVGDRLALGAPRNNFRLEDAPSYVLIAGGIGITPLLPMIAELRTAGVPWSLLYGGRTRSSMAFLAELEDDPAVEIVPEDTHGMLDLERALADVRPGCLIYCCGPGGLLDAVENVSAHWPPDSLHLERFRPRTDAFDASTHTFDAVLARSGIEIRVPPGQTLLDVAARAGVSVPSSCREGTCGTCETGVISGEIDHRDSLLTDAEKATGDCMMICVSRASGERLVLDL